MDRDDTKLCKQIEAAVRARIRAGGRFQRGNYGTLLSSKGLWEAHKTSTDEVKCAVCAIGAWRIGKKWEDTEGSGLKPDLHATLRSIERGFDSSLTHEGQSDATPWDVGNRLVAEVEAAGLMNKEDHRNV